MTVLCCLTALVSRTSLLSVRGPAARDVSQEFRCGFPHAVASVVAGRASQAVIYLFSPIVVATVVVLSWTLALLLLSHRRSSVCIRPVFSWRTLLLALLSALLDCPLSRFSLFPLGSARSDCPTVSSLRYLLACHRLDYLPVRTSLVLVWLDHLVFPPTLRLLGCPYSHHSN
jgi:hypothetical protein